MTGSESAITADDLRRAAALHDAAEARQQFEQNDDDVKAARVHRKRHSSKPSGSSRLINLCLRTTWYGRSALSQFRSSGMKTGLLNNQASWRNEARPASGPASHYESANGEKARTSLDFDPAKQEVYWLPEGTILEAVLTNRLDGEQPGPVNCMITTDVYLPGTRLLLIPQGARRTRRSE